MSNSILGREYYQDYLMDDVFELQNGGRYVKLDLFSKLSGLEYVELYKKTKFNCKFLIAEFTKEGELALQKYPNIYTQLTEALPNLNYQDFTMKSHMVILSK